MSARLSHSAMRLIDNKLDKRNNHFIGQHIPQIFCRFFSQSAAGKRSDKNETYHIISAPQRTRRYSLASSQFCLAVSSASALAGK